MEVPRTDLLLNNKGMDTTKASNLDLLVELGVSMECGDVTEKTVSVEGEAGVEGKTMAVRDGRRRRSYDKDLTVVLECGGKELGPMVLLRAATSLCGSVLAFRQINKLKYETTVSTLQAKGRLLDGFRVGETTVHGRDVTADELVVSFLGLPAYITDEEIVAKLLSWGVSAVSEVRRRVWPGTDVADGTRFVRVRFTDTVRSLPYSVRFDTAAGPEYFRVIHDRQVRVCRGCLQPDHVLRECPDFLCRNCGGQGHYARECTEPRAPKCRECRMFAHLCPCREEEGGESGVRASESGERDEEPQDGVPAALPHPPVVVDAASDFAAHCAEAPVKGGAREAMPCPTPERGEGADISPTLDAEVAAVEPGRGMDEEVAPRLTPEAEEVARGRSQIPKPSVRERGRGESRRPQRVRSRSGRGSASTGRVVPVEDPASTERCVAGRDLSPAVTGTPFVPSVTATFSWADDLLQIETTDCKRRQHVANGGKAKARRSK